MSNIFHLAKMRPVDLGVILGANGENAPSTFEREKNFIENMINEYSASQPGMRFGAILYGDDARVLFRFGDELSSQSAIKAIRKVQRKRRGNDVVAALNLASQDLFADKSGARVNATKTVVILMDKASFRDEKLINAAKKLKDIGVKIIVVAIGPEVTEKAISEIPSSLNGLIRIRDFSKESSKALRLIEPQIPQGMY